MRASLQKLSVLPLLVAVLTGSCGDSAGTESAPQSASLSTTEPAIVFEEVTRDFGVVHDGEHLLCEFPFVNGGGATLSIGKMQASCGCTAAELTTREFAPGAGESVKIDWNPKGFGVQSQTVKLTSNDPERSLVTLTVRADVKPLFELEPRRLDLGHLAMGDSHEARVIIRSAVTGASLARIDGKPNTVSVQQLTGEEAGVPDAFAVLDLTLHGMPKGRFFSTLRLNFEGVQDSQGNLREHQMSLPVTATIYETVRATPNFFAVGLVPPHGQVRHSITLERDVPGEFNILHSEIRGAAFDSLSVVGRPYATPNGHAMELTLLGDVGDYVGPLSGMIHIETDLVEEGPLEFMLMGRVGEATTKL